MEFVIITITLLKNHKTSKPNEAYEVATRPREAFDLYFTSKGNATGITSKANSQHDLNTIRDHCNGNANNQQ